jgi:hypothetical protein
MQTLCLALRVPEGEGTTGFRNVCHLFISRYDVTYRKAQLCSSIWMRTYSFVLREIVCAAGS